MYSAGKDVCTVTQTTDQRKGNISWPYTLVGSRHFERCPYAYDSPAFAYRDCKLQSVDNPVATWDKAELSDCPDPPFSVYLQQLAKNMVSYICFGTISLMTPENVTSNETRRRRSIADFFSYTVHVNLFYMCCTQAYISEVLNRHCLPCINCIRIIVIKYGSSLPVVKMSVILVSTRSLSIWARQIKRDGDC